MNREEDLKKKLASVICNKSCKHTETETVLRKIEQSIVDIIFEEKHGNNLYLYDVINYLENQIDKTKLNSNQKIIDMMDSLINFQNYSRKILSGLKGEKITNRLLSELRNETYCRILSNVSLHDGYFNSEADNIVITKRGIFLIETKTRKHNMIITENGFFIPQKNSKGGCRGTNVLDQLEEQEFLIRDFIRNKGLELNNCLIHSYICFATKDFRVEDRSQSGKVLNLHNLNSTILENQSFINLTNEEIDAYADALSELESDELSKIDFDLDELRTNLIDGIILIEKELKIIDDIEIERKKWKLDWKSAIIGGGIASGTYGLVELIKYYSLKSKTITC